MPKKVKTQLRSGDILPPLERSYDLNRESLDTEARTVECIFSTETPVERWFGIEILDHSKGAARMERLNDGGAFLMDHNSRDQRGVIERAQIKKRQGIALIRFSENDRGEELMQDVKGGIRKKISVGYRIHSLEITEHSDKPDVYRATDWEGHEISSVAIPADPGATTREAALELAEKTFGERTADLSTRVQITHHKTPPTMTKEELKARKEAIEAAARELKVSDEDLQRAIGDESVTVEAFREANKIEPEPAKRKADPEPKKEPEPVRAVDPNSPEFKKAVRAETASEIEYREELNLIRTGYPQDYTAENLTRDIGAPRPIGEIRLEVLESQEKRNKALSFPRENVRGTGPALTPGDRMQRTRDTWTESLRSNFPNVVIPDSGGRDTAPFFERNADPDAWRERAMLERAGEYLTLLDIAALDAGVGAAVIDETIAEAPELAIFPAETQTEGTVELSVLETLPTVGFRNANEGSTGNAPIWKTKLFNMQVLERKVPIDYQGVLKRSKDQGRTLVSQSTPYMKAVTQHFASNAIWYGGTKQTSVDAKAPPGLFKQYSNDSDHEVDATGSSARSSIWFLKLGIDSVDLRFGDDTTLNMGDDWTKESVTVGGNDMLALVNWITGQGAVRLTNKHSAVRIKNLDAGSNKASDSLMFDALELCSNLGMVPNAIFMTNRSRGQIRSARTATTTQGLPAPLPRDFEGIPIYTSLNLSNAEVATM